jgi:acid phosphatase type 7
LGAWTLLVILLLALRALPAAHAQANLPEKLPVGSTPAQLETPLVAFAVGDIADCRRTPAAQSTARLTADLVTPGALVFALGDIAYQYTTAATLADCFEPAWGMHRATTLAIAGNHDYVDGAADEFRRYFGLEDGIDPRFVAYTRWLNASWFLVALDTNVTGALLDAQYEWLRATLEKEFGAPEAAPAAAVASLQRHPWRGL